MSSNPKAARLIPQIPGQQSEEMVHISSFGRVRNNDDEILLVKKLRPEFSAGKWVFPSAIINFGEDPKSAMERIIREQLGVSPSTIKLLDVQSYGDKHWDLCFVYDVTIDRVGKLSQDVETAAYFNRQKLPPEFRSDNLEVLETLEKKKEIARE
jgi:ADP-ribose pyrophosphatase YjhB (NUDIX family)